MKLAQWVVPFQIFGLIAHLILALSLVAIGYFDYLGVELFAKSFFQPTVGNSDLLANRVGVEIVDAVSVVLSLMKTLAASAVISFTTHVVTFLMARRGKNDST